MLPNLFTRNLRKHFRRACCQRISDYSGAVHDGPGLKDFLINGSSNTTDLTKMNVTKNSNGNLQKVFFEVHGCQMNSSDGEVCWSILQSAGYQRTQMLDDATVVLLMTCAIRDSAEQKIWKRLETFKKLNRFRARLRKCPPFKVGLLGCMAERLKEKILEKDKLVDLIVGPDSYRDLPRLLQDVSSGQSAVNVLLSKEETYADIIPVHLTDSPITAFVSIQRGCDNFCSFCIVPFVRGKERSRPIRSIVEEIRLLSDQGIREVTLLGQNVSSFRDLSETTVSMSAPAIVVPGFKSIYKPKSGGIPFSGLLEKIAEINHEMRIRFQSPHPKDFPLDVLQLIRERPNICNQIHLPAQSGSTAVLKIMRRGYSREAYLSLVQQIREILPDVSLTSDMIAGFCGETDQDHRDTLDLIRSVKYSFIYSYPYSSRENTTAYKRFSDDVPQEIKNKRVREINSVFRETALADSKRSADCFQGRTDGGTKVIFPKSTTPDQITSLAPGDYVEVLIENASSQVLHGRTLKKSSVLEFFSVMSDHVVACDASSYTQVPHIACS